MKIRITTTFTGLQQTILEVPDGSDLGEIRGLQISRVIFDPQAFLISKQTDCTVSAEVEELIA